MKDLKDYASRMLTGWAEQGICTQCFADIKGDVLGHTQDHRPWCPAKTVAIRKAAEAKCPIGEWGDPDGSCALGDGCIHWSQYV